MLAPPNHLQLETGFGPVVVVWRELRSRARVLRIYLPGKGSVLGRVRRAFPGVAEGTCPELKRLGRGITRFLEGEAVGFDLKVAALDRCSGFQQRVLRAEHRVLRGRVTTYGRLAASIGSPSSARAVGAALAGNPFPLIIPCHRAVRTDGSIGGYQGGPRMKRTLLEMEGVGFRPDGRVLPDFLSNPV